jgi:adenosylmethionine-8-amino-7-oxononanoate aminotransferase
VEYVDPRDGSSFLPPELGVARRVDVEALRRGLIVYSTQPTADGYAGDQTLLAPAFTSAAEELSLVVERLAATIDTVAREARTELGLGSTTRAAI